MPVYGDEVVVLRSQQLGEADRLLTLFGKERGLVRAVARGVRRTSSKFGARLEPFTVVDVQLFTRNPLERSGLETVTQAVTIDAYAARIVEDYAAYTAASVMVETCARIIDAEPAPQQWALLVGALRSLARAEREPQLALDSYLLRALSLAGWEPSFANCARCDRPGPHSRISFGAGGAVCDDCAIAVGATTVADIDVMRHLWALLAGSWRVADAAEPSVRDRASQIVAGYVEFHLDRSLRSLGVRAADRRP
ncbi:DNA repair protein RecO [Gulosibacter macacae]|uniref:DNA repair protein RecO n=1 Tax=Gulosibacter macacae TaxID=2488791 RepID=A0A3P3W157_9MICO|nr:DNA repair protein RecO [Gulosibacter macacae]RRJ88765.1 DNA repair protein RecO [Gulosibacter macacae]